MNDIAKELSSIIPKSLDDIVRANRHLVELRLANDEELAALAGPVPAGPAKHEISNFRLVSMVIKNPATVSVHLLGTCGTGESWGTSAVVKLDEASGYVLTNSGSIYKLLGTRHQDQPGSLDLIGLCALMNQWGLRRILGIPPFFY